MMVALAGLLLLLASAAPAPAAATPATPPRGFNSWDAYKQNLNESAAMEIAQSMVELLLPHGYDTLVIDGGWSDAYNHDECGDCVDEYGRAQPSVAKWPSSSGGRGLKPFIDKMHAMGLKVGMHTLQGSITKAALNANSSVLGQPGVTVNHIVGPGCSWQKWGFGVDMSQPAGQAYLNSVYGQYAEWGLDLIKNDCVFAINWGESGSPLIRGVKRAIEQGGHSTVYSLSPGQQSTLAMGENISHVADMFRITGDWHDCGPKDGPWGKLCPSNLTYHFAQAHLFEPLIGTPSYPDLDILSPYNLAADAHDPGFRFQMTLWAIVRSPLFIGLDLRLVEAADLVLLTNKAVLEVNAHSRANRQAVMESGGRYVWVAEAMTSSAARPVLYVALFNNGPREQPVSATLAQLGLGRMATCDVDDLWTGQAAPIHATGGKVTAILAGNTGAELLKFSNCK